MKYILVVFFMNLLPQYAGKSLRRDDSYPKTLEDIKNEISGYTDIAKAIIDLVVHGKAQNRSYERLAVFADTIGPRLSGSKNLDAAIQYMFSALQEDGLENVHLEPVKIPHWERGEESAMMLEPRNHSIALLGLGSSVATPPEGNSSFGIKYHLLFNTELYYTPNNFFSPWSNCKFLYCYSSSARQDAIFLGLLCATCLWMMQFGWTGL